MANLIYELSFKGSASSTVRAMFDDFDVVASHGITTVRGRVPDQAALHGALGRIHDLGLELLEVRLVAEADAGDLPQWDAVDPDDR